MPQFGCTLAVTEVVTSSVEDVVQVDVVEVLVSLHWDGGVEGALHLVSYPVKL